MKIVKITTMCVAIIFMVSVGILTYKISENIEYLAGSTDYQIQLLDQIAGNVEPLMQLQELSSNRSFSCSINTPRFGPQNVQRSFSCTSLSINTPRILDN